MKYVIEYGKPVVNCKFFPLKNDCFEKVWDTIWYLGNEDNHRKCDSYQIVAGTVIQAIYDSTGMRSGYGIIAIHSKLVSGKDGCYGSMYDDGDNGGS